MRGHLEYGATKDWGRGIKEREQPRVGSWYPGRRDDHGGRESPPDSGLAASRLANSGRIAPLSGGLLHDRWPRCSQLPAFAASLVHQGRAEGRLPTLRSSVLTLRPSAMTQVNSLVNPVRYVLECREMPVRRTSSPQASPRLSSDRPRHGCGQAPARGGHARYGECRKAGMPLRFSVSTSFSGTASHALWKRCIHSPIHPSDCPKNTVVPDCHEEPAGIPDSASLPTDDGSQGTVLSRGAILRRACGQTSQKRRR